MLGVLLHRADCRPSFSRSDTHAWRCELGAPCPWSTLQQFTRNLQSKQQQASEDHELTDMNKLNLCRVIALFLIGTVVPTSLMASPSELEIQDGRTTVTTEHRDWTSTCISQADTETKCAAEQIIRAMQGSTDALQFEISISREDSTNRAAISLPLGIELMSGIVLQVDDLEEFNAPVRTCIAQGCISFVEMDDSRIAELKGGKRLKLGFLPLGKTEVSVVEFSLTGFSRAFDWIVQEQQ